MLVIALAVALVFILVWVIAFIHAMLKKDSRSISPGNDLGDISDPELAQLLRDCDKVCSHPKS